MAIKIQKYSAQDEPVWNDFVSKLKRTHFFFQRNFMDYHADRFEDHSLMFYDEDELIAILPANKNEGVLNSHQGLTFGSLLSEDLGASKTINCFSLLKDHCRVNNFKEVVYKAMPSIYGLEEQDLYALTRSGFQLDRRDISTVVNLGANLDLRKDKKRNYNKGNRLGLTYREEKDLSSYWDILESILSQYHQAKPTHSLSEIQMLAENFQHNIKHYLLRDDEGKAIGGVVLFIERNVVHTQYMSVLDEGRKIGALDYLIVSLMKEFKDSHDYFSFGISTEDNGKVLNEGLIFQKEGFGGSGLVHDFYKLRIDE